MATRAHNFFASTVEPTVSEFFGDERNIRRARLAAIVLFHMADYWNLQNEPNPTDETLKLLRRELIKDCPDFKLIRDVANASKHDRLTRKANPPLTLSGSEQIMRPPGIFEAPFGAGVFNEASEVMIALNDGTTRPLRSVVQSVLSMWRIKLQ